jgi:hypothetical protein|tara:strand:+ start:458 stop:616 length:159 start_codon:yes stop_codon:yes gene_type:complete
MQKLNTQLLKKVSKRKTNIKDNILFTIVSLAALYGLIYALCMIITLIEFITL